MVAHNPEPSFHKAVDELESFDGSHAKVQKYSLAV